MGNSSSQIFSDNENEDSTENPKNETTQEESGIVTVYMEQENGEVDIWKGTVKREDIENSVQSSATVFANLRRIQRKQDSFSEE